jgi:nucleotide-binding universal stress UspA family protein
MQPILTCTDSVTVFAFDSYREVLKEETELLRGHLAAHGVQVHAFTWPDTGEIDPEGALVSCLSEENADLIVAGDYVHPRLVERLLGGDVILSFQRDPRGSA